MGVIVNLFIMLLVDNSPKIKNGQSQQLGLLWLFLQNLP